jgi:hypothetical protein
MSTKAYREANAEKIAAAGKAYYEANREKIAAAAKAYREANPEKKAATGKAYREANSEKVYVGKWRYKLGLDAPAALIEACTMWTMVRRELRK